METKKIPIQQKIIEGFCLQLGQKKLIILKGKLGYIMCGYLDLSVAESLGEVAVKVTGVDSIDAALESRVCQLTSAAKDLGIYQQQPIYDVLQIIA
jgi:uncharacterized protein YunC (DUF1805 family)